MLMELALGIAGILIFALAFKAQLHISLTNDRDSKVSMPIQDIINKYNCTEEGIDQATMNDMPEFLARTAERSREQGNPHQGIIHVLAFCAKVRFQVWPAELACKQEEKERCFEELWCGGITSLRDVDMENVLVERSVRLSLKYLGSSHAVVVLPD